MAPTAETVQTAGVRLFCFLPNISAVIRYKYRIIRNCKQQKFWRTDHSRRLFRRLTFRLSKYTVIEYNAGTIGARNERLLYLFIINDYNRSIHGRRNGILFFGTLRYSIWRWRTTSGCGEGRQNPLLENFLGKINFSRIFLVNNNEKLNNI